MTKSRVLYSTPTVVSFSEDQLLDLLGPARTYRSPESIAPAGDPSQPAGGKSSGSTKTTRQGN